MDGIIVSSLPRKTAGSIDIDARPPVREDGTEQVKQKNITTLDDNKSQLACRFLMNLDKQLNFSDRRVHEAALYALDCFTSAQYSNGAWPQRYQDFNHQSKSVVVNATIPVAWSREYPGAKYANFYTLNDNTISDMILLMLDAWEIYADRRCWNPQKGGDFLLLAQLPEPQPSAQQYNEQMHPAWARKFEPPAITGGESQGVMKTLMTLYRVLPVRTLMLSISLAYLRPSITTANLYLMGVWLGFTNWVLTVRST